MKQLNHLLLLISFLNIHYIFSEITLDTKPYEAQARAWVKTYISPKSDIALIANLIYFSFLRSAATLAAQDTAAKALESTLEGYQNIARTRMNPSHDLPYPVNFDEQQQLFEQFAEVQYSHRTIGMAYSHCAEYAVNSSSLKNDCKKAVEELRLSARKVVTQAVLDIKRILGELYDFAAAHARTEQETDEYRFDIMEMIGSYIPYFAVQSFLEAERINNQATEHSANILLTITQVSKKVWEAIEQARASYYLAHYRSLQDMLKNNGIDLQRIPIMFDEYGSIPQSKQRASLPPL